MCLTLKFYEISKVQTSNQAETSCFLDSDNHLAQDGGSPPLTSDLSMNRHEQTIKSSLSSFFHVIVSVVVLLLDLVIVL